MTGDNQRRARFVNQNGVHFVDNGEVERTLHHFVNGILHVVAQIVKAEFVVRAVSDVASVSFAAFLVRQSVDDSADGHAQKAVNLSHPVGVAFCQIVVDGNDMNAFSRQRVQINRQSRNQRFSFTRAHFRDLSAVQNDAADQLDVEMALSDGAFGGFANGCKGIRQNVVQRFAVRQPFFQHRRAGFQFFVRKGSDFRFKRVDFRDGFPQSLDIAFVRAAKDFAHYRANHFNPLI